MSGVDACVSLLEIPVCCVLKKKRSKYGFDGNITFVLVLFRFVSFASRWYQQQTEGTTQGTLYMANKLLMRHLSMA
jgi:hypothetical protein